MFTAATPVATIQLETMLAETNDFGNAVDFAIALCDRLDRRIIGRSGSGSRRRSWLWFRGWELLPPNEKYV
jgi:hypothetical protein